MSGGPVDATPFDAVPLAVLRERRSVRWRMYPPDVLPSFVAEMDFPLAEPIAAVLHQAIDRSDTGYAWPKGLPGVVADHALRTWGWSFDPEQTIVVGDVLSGLAATLRALTLPDDAVAVLPPVYAPFYSTVREVAERSLVEVPLVPDAEGRPVPDLAALESAFRHGVRTLVLCQPHNPTGVVLSAAELGALARLAAAHDVLVISDEVHAPLTMPGVTHVPFAVVGATLTRTVTISAASKAWNLPGLKCAWVVPGSDDVAARLADGIPIEVRIGTGHLGALAAEAALTAGDPWLRRAVATIDLRRHELTALLAQRLPGVQYRPPDAGYLAWLDARALGLGDDPAVAFLARGRVALSNGPSFGTGGDGHVRLTLATSGELLADVVERMALALG